MKILQPAGWEKPKGYSNGIAVKGGTTVFIAGQVAFKDGEHTGAKPGRVVAGPGTGKCVPVEG